MAIDNRRSTTRARARGVKLKGDKPSSRTSERTTREDLQKIEEAYRRSSGEGRRALVLVAVALLQAAQANLTYEPGRD